MVAGIFLSVSLAGCANLGVGDGGPKGSEWNVAHAADQTESGQWRRFPVDTVQARSVASDESSVQPSDSQKANRGLTKSGDAEIGRGRPQSQVDAGELEALLKDLPDQQANELQVALASLQEIGDFNQEAQQRLIENLQQTDPALWPQIIQTIHDGLAYRRGKTVGKNRRGQGQTDANEPGRMALASAEDSPSNSRRGDRRVQKGRPNRGARDKNPRGSARQDTQDRDSLDHESSPADDASRFSTDTQLVSHQEPLPGELDDEAGPSALAEKKVINDEADTNAPAQIDPRPGRRSPPVEEELVNDLSDQDWIDPLWDSIDSLEQAVNSTADATSAAEMQSRLKLLYLVAGEREKSLSPIAKTSSAQRDFWSNELFGLGVMLDHRQFRSTDTRATEALTHLRRAAASLAEEGSLVVKNAAFCTEVKSYGVFTEFKTQDFAPEQQVLIYAELENFQTKESAKGFYTAIKTSYQILDVQGHKVASEDLSLVEETCRNPRRDFFLRFFLRMPRQIYPGEYTLQLMVEDMLGQKTGQGTIAFKIAEKSAK